VKTPRSGRAVKTIRIGVIGAGFGKAVHVPAFRSDERVEIVAIAASSDESARRAAMEVGIERATGDWRTIVDAPDIDAISIALPPLAQVQVARRAIAKRKHVFLEKPLAATLVQARALAAAAKKARIVHAIDFEFPEIPAWRKARELLPQIGAVRNVVVQWHFETYAHRTRSDSWKLRPSDAGGTLNHFVSHVFHNLEWLVGPIARLSARLSASGGIPEVIVDLLLTFKSGIPGTVAVSANTPAGPGHVVELFGERGTLTLRNPGPKYFEGFSLTLGTRDAVTNVPVQRLAQDRIEVVGSLARRFVDAIVTRSVVEPNIVHGLRVQTLIDAARRSDRQRRWVKT
jgi:predicted dehydrogenase